MDVRHRGDVQGAARTDLSLYQNHSVWSVRPTVWRPTRYLRDLDYFRATSRRFTDEYLTDALGRNRDKADRRADLLNDVNLALSRSVDNKHTLSIASDRIEIVAIGADSEAPK
jgi:hypothetical protein